MFSHSPSSTDSKNIKISSELQWEVPPQASYIIQRKFKKKQRKILKVSISKFWIEEHIPKSFNGLDLHSLSPDRSFDIHIAIYNQYKCRQDRCVKRSVWTSGMQTNAIKHLLNMFNSSKCLNTDFQNFPLYFLKFPLYNVRGLSGPFPCSLRLEILHVILDMVEEWDKLCC